MEKSAKNQKGTFFNTSLWPGETWFHFDSFTNQDSKFIDTWSELHKYQKPSHQSRTTSPEGAGLLCPCQAPTQGELKPHSLVNLAQQKERAFMQMQPHRKQLWCTILTSQNRLELQQWCSLVFTQLLSDSRLSSCTFKSWNVRRTRRWCRRPGKFLRCSPLSDPTAATCHVCKKCHQTWAKNKLNDFQMGELLEEDLI